MKLQEARQLIQSSNRRLSCVSQVCTELSQQTSASTSWSETFIIPLSVSCQQPSTSTSLSAVSNLHNEPLCQQADSNLHPLPICQQSGTFSIHLSVRNLHPPPLCQPSATSSLHISVSNLKPPYFCQPSATFSLHLSVSNVQPPPLCQQN